MPDALVLVRGLVVGDDPRCEAITDGGLSEPVAAVSSLAFVVAALAIPVAVGLAGRRSATGMARRRSAARTTPREPARWTGVATFALLCAGVGVGSFLDHGPEPPLSAVAHGLPLAGVLAFVAADSLADLTGRAAGWLWWAVPTAVVTALIVPFPALADAAQVVLAAAAVAAPLGRALRRPDQRRRIVLALALLGAGAAIGRLSRAGGPLCFPDSIWQGHAAWHLMAAAALVVLAPVIGRRGGSA